MIPNSAGYPSLDTRFCPVELDKKLRKELLWVYDKIGLGIFNVLVVKLTLSKESARNKNQSASPSSPLVEKNKTESKCLDLFNKLFK